jgi:hypothetical protein
VAIEEKEQRLTRWPRRGVHDLKRWPSKSKFILGISFSRVPLSANFDSGPSDPTPRPRPSAKLLNKFAQIYNTAIRRSDARDGTGWSSSRTRVGRTVDQLRSTGADEFLQRCFGNGQDFVPLNQHLIKRREESFRYRGECSVSCKNWRVDWRERARINQR